MPGTEPNLTTQESTALAAACNEYDNDFYGNAWTSASVSAAHNSPSADINQIKKLVRLAALLAIAVG